MFFQGKRGGNNNNTCTSFTGSAKGLDRRDTSSCRDRLQLLNGEYVIIEQVQHELLETPVTVYNFEVALNEYVLDNRMCYIAYPKTICN